MRSHGPRLTQLMAVGTVLLAACSGPVMTPTPSDTGTPFPTDDDFARVMRAVGGADDPQSGELDELWRSIAAAAFVAGQGPYDSPARVTGYRGSHETPATPCADGHPQSIWQQNARYCPDDRSIYYDEGWLREFAARSSRLAPAATNFAGAAILGHEWGHHVQAEAGISGESIALELQADCFAGIFLGASESVANGQYRMEDDELAAGLAAFFEIGNRDYRASEWMAEHEHGSRQQRLMAFATGYQGALGDWEQLGTLVNGYPWCYGYRDFRPDRFLTLGRYRLVELPGRPGQHQGDWYEIEPQAGTGYATPAARLRWLDQLPAPAGAPLLDQLVAATAQALPGSELLYDPLTQLGHGSGQVTAHYFERPLTGTDGQGWESGIVALLVPADGDGGLLMVASRHERAPSDGFDRAALARVFEEVATIAQLGYRLCGPGESGTFGDPRLNVACAEDL